MKRKMLCWTNRPWAMELLPGLNTVGRNPTNTVRVSDASVSSFHCEILWEDDVVTLRDLASTNGTFIDDQPVREAVLLKNQTLRLGNVSFTVEDAEDAETALPQPPVANDSADSVTEVIPRTKKPAGGLLGRLTQTLRLPFGG